MSKYLYLVVFLFLSNTIVAVDTGFLSGKWAILFAERNDGSQIVINSSIPQKKEMGIPTSGYVNFYQKTMDAAPYLGGEYNFAYTVKKNKLETAEYKYNITVYDSAHIVLSEEFTDKDADKTTQILLEKESFLVDSINHSYSLRYHQDTIEYNNYVFPTPSKSIDAVLKQVFKDQKISGGWISGHIYISRQKKISTILVGSRANFSDEQVEYFRDSLIAANISWTTPKNKDAVYLLPFTYFFSSYPTQYSLFLPFKNIASAFREPKAPSTEAADHYKEGMAFYTKNQLDSAIQAFDKSIAADNNYLDAYYGRADAFFKAEKKEQACDDWQYLVNLRQQKAEKLYEQNCGR